MNMSPVKDQQAATPSDSDADHHMYAEWKRVYPKKAKGTFRNLKTAAMWATLLVYFLSPYLRWSRGFGAPDQAILIDLPGRRAYFFFIEIWPQEVYYLTGLLIIAAILLFVVSSLFGRLWCGYACWQTVFTDLFIMVEDFFEGDRNTRIKLARAPMSMNKFVRKGGTYLTWALISFAVGAGFTQYFHDARELFDLLFSSDPSTATWGTIAVVGGFCFLLAGWAREQICIYMCPYSRFQGAMFDDDSLLVTYEAWRGEPRAPMKLGENFDNRGHCVDCKACVQVCPTGIDIRNGQQLACIGCALCVDACNAVMDRFKLPRGLVTWDSINNQLARSKGQSTKLHLLRVRTFVYVFVLSLVAGIMAYGLAHRSTMDVKVQHDRSPVFVQLSNGTIKNGYTFKIYNKIRETETYTLTMAGIPDATLTVFGVAEKPVTTVDLTVDPDTVGTFQVHVFADPDKLKKETSDLSFMLVNKATGSSDRYDAWFTGPQK
jgi:cytochrome c oxidase accessory protein FixG